MKSFQVKARNREIKSDSGGKISDRNEKHAIGNWRKGDLCYKLAKNLGKLYSCSSVLWKVDVVSIEIGYLAEAISKQSVEEMTWLLLSAYSEM